MKKKVKFGHLKAGAKFRYERCLYLKDDMDCDVRISNGAIKSDDIDDDTLVTPVKIKISEVK